MSTWGILLNGVYLQGGEASDIDPVCALPEPSGCIVNPPDGLGLPGLRTGDVTFAQRDGVRHFNDYYEPRILTLEVTACPDGCPGCPSARQKVRDITHAWSRQCDDVELVVFTDCHGTDPDRSLVGPYGMVGRPRTASVEWVRGPSKCANLLLRFDAIDHRLFVLDECGVPGSGEECVNLTPTIESNCRNYDRCYTGGPDLDSWCYDVSSGQSGNEAVANVAGTLCACAILTLNGTLTDPIIENVTTGEKIQYNGTILAANPPVVIDGSDGTATSNGASRTHFLSGSPTFCLEPGSNQLRMFSFGENDDGNVDICWRPAVDSG